MMRGNLRTKMKKRMRTGNERMRKRMRTGNERTRMMRRMKLTFGIPPVGLVL